MRSAQLFLTSLLVLLLTACGNTMTQPIQAPDGMVQSGTFTIRTDQLMRLAAGTSGEGTLIFEGWEHRFAFSDAKVSVAGSNPEVHGTVFNLEKVEDFEGRYTPFEAEFDDGEGLVGGWARNDKGVVVYLRYDAEHVSVNLEAKGATARLLN